MSVSFIKRAMLVAVIASFGAIAPSYADSESGGFVFGGGDSESGGAYNSGSSSSSGVLWGVGASSESGGVMGSGAESESGGVANNGSESESGGARNSGASSEAPVEPINMRRDNPYIKDYKWTGNGKKVDIGG